MGREIGQIAFTFWEVRVIYFCISNYVRMCYLVLRLKRKLAELVSNLRVSHLLEQYQVPRQKAGDR